MTETYFLFDIPYHIIPKNTYCRYYVDIKYGLLQYQLDFYHNALKLKVDL